MAVTLSVKHDIRKAEQFFHRTGRRAVKKAAVAAINKTIRKVNTLAKRVIAANAGPGVNQKRVAKSLNISRLARFPTNIWAELSAYTKKDHGINIIEGVPQSQRNQAYWRKKSTKGKKSYIAGVVSRSWNKKRTYAGTFIVHGKNSGKPLVFSRDPSNKNKLHFTFGPSVRMMFKSKTVMTALLRKADIEWPKEFERSVSFFLGFRKLRRHL